MIGKDVVVIGASTGGIEALKTLVGKLPADFPGSIFVVLHTNPQSPNVLDRILVHAGPLPASNARDGERIERGHIYIASADHHLLLEPEGIMRLTRGPKENRFRPAVDTLFRSAAQAFGPRVVGVVLTGWLDDGTAGLWAIKERGGTAIVQHPEEAIASGMPLNALKHVEVEFCVKLQDLAPLLVRLSASPAHQEGDRPVSERMKKEVSIAREDQALERGVLQLGPPSVYACPECHGVLMQVEEGSYVRFRCHTGHAYSMETLLADFSEKTEETLWNAIRSLEETMLLLRQMADRFTAAGRSEEATHFEKKIAETEQRTNALRCEVLKRLPMGEIDPPRRAVG